MKFFQKLLIFYEQVFLMKKEALIQENGIFDTKRNGLYRDRGISFLADRFVRSESMADAHYHPYYELFYVVSGQCRMFVEHSLFSVGAGELVIIPSATLHRTQYDENVRVDRITVSFTEEYVSQLLEIAGQDFLNKNGEIGKICFSGEAKTELELLFGRLLKEEKNGDEFSELEIKSLLLNLFVILARNKERKTVKDFEGNEAAVKIQETARYIYENFDQDITLEKASQIAGMRDTYFSRMFREITGFGFKEYLTNVRIQQSVKMLTTGNLTITQIALACGFADGNYFGDAFKKSTGLSPREFRKSR